MSGALSIRETLAGDNSSVPAILKDAFGQPDEADLVEALRAADAIALELTASIDGQIVGYCAFSLVTAEPPLLGPALGLAPLAVATAHQNCGAGSALVETGLGICRERGASLVVVLGEPNYYSRFGFIPASRQNISWAAMDAGDAFQIIDYAKLGDSPARRIHYHPAFSAV